MRLGYILGISLQTELLLLSFFGILSTIFDTSLLEFSSNMNKIWDMPLDPNLFAQRTSVIIKYILSGVLLVRTFTIHIYLGTYIIMLYPLLFEDRPGLIIPWMAINILKCHITGFVAVLTGLYICVMYRFMKPSCWEFLLSETADYMPSLYMFSLVLRFYHELNKFLKIAMYIDPNELRARRRRTRLIAETQQALENRSVEGVNLKRRDVPRVPTVQNHVSISPFDINAITQSAANNQSAGNNGPEVNNVTLFSMRDAAVSGRSFKVSGTVLEIHGPDMPQNQATATDMKRIDRTERVQRIDDLDENQPAYQVPSTSHQIASQARPKVRVPSETPPCGEERPVRCGKHDYSTVSELLNDPDIAIVLDMIAGKDDPFQTDLSLLEKYNITVEEPTWTPSQTPQQALETAPVKRTSLFPQGREPLVVKPDTQDATNQVRSPKFEEVMNRLAQVASGSNSISGTHIGIGKDTAKDQQIPTKEKSKKEASPEVNEIYKNRAAYPRTYKDDGYTQAYEERMLRLKEAQTQKQT